MQCFMDSQVENQTYVSLRKQMPISFVGPITLQYM